MVLPESPQLATHSKGRSGLQPLHMGAQGRRSVGGATRQRRTPISCRLGAGAPPYSQAHPDCAVDADSQSKHSLPAAVGGGRAQPYARVCAVRCLWRPLAGLAPLRGSAGCARALPRRGGPVSAPRGFGGGPRSVAAPPLARSPRSKDAAEAAAAVQRGGASLLEGSGLSCRVRGCPTLARRLGGSSDRCGEAGGLRALTGAEQTNDRPHACVPSGQILHRRRPHMHDALLIIFSAPASPQSPLALGRKLPPP